MRCTTLAAITPFLALSLLGSACGDSRTPGPGPVNKDAAASINPDAPPGSVNPDAPPGSVNPDAPASAGDPDAAAMGFADAGSMMANADAAACACDLNPNACDQGCGCDSRCGGNPDASVVVRPDATPMMAFDGGTLMGDPFNPQQLAAQYATAFCAHRETCEPVFFPFLGQTRAQCETDNTAALLGNFSALQPLIAVGRTAFSQSNFTRCMNAYNTALTACAVGVDPIACDDIFIGNRPEGASCGSAEECSNSWCAANFNQCGACTAYAPVGDDCSQNVCGPATECVPLNDGSEICLNNTAGLNGMCGTLATGVCRGHLQCTGPAMGPLACQAPAAPNAACDPMGEINAACDILQAQVCGPNNTCVPLNLVGAMAGCGMGNPTNRCTSSFRCDTATMQCVARPVAGGMCNAMVGCANGFFCNPTGAGSAQGTCTAEFMGGTACMGSAQCAGNNVCVGGSCGPVAYAANCN